MVLSGTSDRHQRCSDAPKEKAQMSNQTREVLITLLLVFAVGAFFLPSQAQRATQKTSPTGSAARAKAPTAKPGRSAQKSGESLTPVYAQAVEFAESVPVRNLPPANRSISNSKNGPPEVEGHEINEKNTEEVRQ